MQKLNPVSAVITRILARHDAQLRQRLFGGELAYWHSERSNNQMLPDRHYCMVDCNDRTASRAMAVIARIIDSLELGLKPTISRSGDAVAVILNRDDFMRLKEHLHPPQQQVNSNVYLDVAVETGFFSAETYLRVEELLRDEQVRSQQGEFYVDQRLERMKCESEFIKGSNVIKGSIPSFSDLKHALRAIGQWQQKLDEKGEPVPDEELARTLRPQIDKLLSWLGLSMERLYRNTDMKLGDHFIQRLNQAVQLWDEASVPASTDTLRKHAAHLSTGGELLRNWSDLPTRVKQNFTKEERYLFDHTPNAANQAADRIDLYNTMLDLSRTLRREALDKLGEEVMRPTRHQKRDTGEGMTVSKGHGHGRVLREQKSAPDPAYMPLPMDRSR